MTTKAEYARAYEEGQAARRAGRPIEVNPYRFRKGRDGDLLWDRWIDGWMDQDATNKGAARVD